MAFSVSCQLLVGERMPYGRIILEKRIEKLKKKLSCVTFSRLDADQNN